jgi:transmembrane sensor
VTSCGSVAGRPVMLGALMRAATPTASLPQQEGRTRLIASVEKMRRPCRAKSAWAFAATAAAAALLVVCAREGSDGTPIEWYVENGTASARGYVSVPLTAPTARLVFGDGSDVALAPGSRGRVSGTTSAGATVVLEHGSAGLHVQNSEHARWLVDAGPFALRVNATDLLVAWSADSETLDVWMRSGHVEVTGPVLVDAVSLSAGQHVRARLRDGTLQIDGEGLPPSRDLGSEPCAVR